MTEAQAKLIKASYDYMIYNSKYLKSEVISNSADCTCSRLDECRCYGIKIYHSLYSNEKIEVYDTDNTWDIGKFIWYWKMDEMESQ